MSGKIGRASKIAAAVILVVNLIVMTFCAILFAVALWMISAPTSLSSVIQMIGDPNIKTLLPQEVLSVQLGVAIVLLTSFLFFVSFMGLYGAISRSQFLLFMYSTLVFLLLLLECALMFYFSSNIAEKGLQEQDGQWTHALRLAFHCCEHNYSIPQEVSKLPWSCCGTSGYPNNCTVPLVYNKDCQRTITTWLQKHQVAIYVSLAILHLILSFCSLLRRSSSASSSHR